MIAVPNHRLILIADEAHNIGSTSVKRAFEKLKIEKRVALSATPNRAYDPEGTAAIEQFFNDHPPYCYSFPLERAISEGYLSRYQYFPRIVKLTATEFDSYAKITRQLLRHLDGETGKLKNNPFVTQLLIKRKNIIHRAENKIDRLLTIVNSIGIESLKYCLIYAPEGENETRRKIWFEV